jgi:hypothetical protein
MPDRPWLLRASRPPRPGELLGLRVPLVAVSGAILLLSHLPRLVAATTYPCLFRRLTGYPCMVCGSVRSFLAMAEGQWAYALPNSPLAATLYVALHGVLVWNLAGLLFRVHLERGPLLGSRVRPRTWVWISAAAIALNWAYRLACGLK